MASDRPAPINARRRRAAVPLQHGLSSPVWGDAGTVLGGQKPKCRPISPSTTSTSIVESGRHEGTATIRSSPAGSQR